MNLVEMLHRSLFPAGHRRAKALVMTSSNSEWSVGTRVGLAIASSLAIAVLVVLAGPGLGLSYEMTQIVAIVGVGLNIWQWARM